MYSNWDLYDSSGSQVFKLALNYTTGFPGSSYADVGTFWLTYLYNPIPIIHFSLFLSRELRLMKALSILIRVVLKFIPAIYGLRSDACSISSNYVCCLLLDVIIIIIIFLLKGRLDVLGKRNCYKKSFNNVVVSFSNGIGGRGVKDAAIL